MKNSVMKNSMIARAGLQCAAFVKAGLRRADGMLKTINRYSAVDRLFRSVMRSTYRGIGKLYVNADLLKAAGGIILKSLRMMIKGITGFLYSIYYGSFVMEIVGRAAVNSRWLR